MEQAEQMEHQELMVHQLKKISNKMGLNEIVKKIKTFLAEEIEVQPEMIDIKTKDGIIISVTGLEIGAEIYIVDETGKNPAPDGDYILEDNTKISVVEGKIATVEPGEEPIESEEPVEVDVEAADTDTATTTEAPSEPSELEALKLKIENLEAKYAEISTILSELAENLSEKELKKEIKTEMSKINQPKVERPLNKSNYNLDNIFDNMYNRKF